jgi:formate hydrogenlyase subunit 3/multisubunit Na+/H+ antiporter MnhD subunit
MIYPAVGVGLILLAGVAAVALRMHPRIADGLFRLGVLAGATLLLWPAVALLVRHETGMAAGDGWYGLDLLSAWFLIIVLGVGIGTAWYGVRYLAAERGHRQVAWAHAVLAILLVGLSGVVTARGIVPFLLAWEIMAISAWLLVMFDHQQPTVRRAGFVYLILTHTATIALFGMFAAWSGGNLDLSFQSLGTAPGSHELVLLFALAGFGIKAGIVPVHFWLPGAHAAAPSHISAVLSGIMLKMGVYGLLRVLTLTGAPPAWWGWTVLTLGLGSAILGVVWALAQHDLKRLLAYHSVENIGIIFLGIGLGALGSAYGRPALALLGYAGAILHSLNHALFKSLLFLGAGVVGRVAGSRELDRLGGLGRVIPRTATAFLIGSLAIVGLPPLNGFVSEWLIFRGLFQAGTDSDMLRVASGAAAGLALTGGLALACFTKVHGTVFLGTMRDPGLTARAGAESGLVGPQIVLAIACGVIGVVPWLVLPPAAEAARSVIGGTGSDTLIRGMLAPARTISLVALVLGGVTFLVWLLRRSASRIQAREVDTWACGYPAVTSRMQYPASGFAASLLAAFGPLTGTRIESEPGRFHVSTADPILDQIGRRLWERIRGVATSIRLIQTGRLRWYLVYLISVVVALLIYLWMAR